jgi:membrane protease subunit HflK
MYGDRRPEFDPDQLMQNLRQGWERFKSRLPGGGGSSLVIGAAIVVIALVWAASGVYQVEANEQAVTRLFGKFATVTEPGLRVWWPSPIGSIDKIGVTETRTLELGFRPDPERDVPVEALMITGDLNIADVKLAVQYRVSDIKAFVFNVDDPGDPDRLVGNQPDGRTLRDATEASLRQVVGRSSIDSVLTLGKEQVQLDTLTLLQGLMDEYRTGIQILSVSLQEVTPPDAVRAAFDDVVAARSDKVTRQNQADAFEQDQIPRAEGAAAQTRQEATGFRDSRIARAEGEADQFTTVLKEYAQSPQVTRQRLYLEAMEEILPGITIYLIDDQSGGVLPFLPLTGGVPSIPGVAGQ